MITDTIGNVTNDAISDILLVSLVIIEIADAFIHFALFNGYCPIDRLENW